MSPGRITVHMAKRNQFSFSKRQREMKRKKKSEEKRLKRLARKQGLDPEEVLRNPHLVGEDLTDDWGNPIIPAPNASDSSDVAEMPRDDDDDDDDDEDDDDEDDDDRD
jgi:hypothetical protein